MGTTKQPEPVKFFCGIIAVDEETITMAKARLKNLFGKIDIQSDIIPFNFTEYYRQEMGDKLLRQFVCFAELIDPGRIAGIKQETNRLEEEFSTARNGLSCRRANLDPGYLCASRIILATTKDFSHRIYLEKGIYAEVTLNFRKDGMTYHPWTYPDFKSEFYRAFFMMARREYMTEIARDAQTRIAE